MAQIIEFIGNHALLVGAFAGVAALLAWNLFAPSLQGYGQVSPSAAVQLINHEDAVLVDVRELSEYDTGSVLNSIHIPLGSVRDHLARLEKYRDKPIIVMCNSGHRSASACATLKSNGFTKLHNLTGGILAWQNAGLPVVTGKKRRS